MATSALREQLGKVRAEMAVTGDETESGMLALLYCLLTFQMKSTSVMPSTLFSASQSVALFIVLHVRNFIMCFKLVIRINQYLALYLEIVDLLHLLK